MWRKMPTGLKYAELIPDGPALIGKCGTGYLNQMKAAELVGAPWVIMVDMAFAIYIQALNFADEKGIIIADTTFEFGMVEGEVTLIGDVLTPDNSKFWIKSNYKAGDRQPSYDKQDIITWLKDLGWTHKDVLPEIPDNVVDATLDKYKTLFSTLTMNFTI